jgi:hypothetical protein
MRRLRNAGVEKGQNSAPWRCRIHCDGAWRAAALKRQILAPLRWRIRFASAWTPQPVREPNFAPFPILELTMFWPFWSDREDKWHYKGAYRAQPIFRIKEVQIWLPTTWIQGVDSGPPLRTQYGMRTHTKMKSFWEALSSLQHCHLSSIVISPVLSSLQYCQLSSAVNYLDSTGSVDKIPSEF